MLDLLTLRQPCRRVPIAPSFLRSWVSLLKVIFFVSLITFIDCVSFVASRLFYLVFWSTHLSLMNCSFISLSYLLWKYSSFFVLNLSRLCNNEINSMEKGVREKSINYSGAVSSKKPLLLFLSSHSQHF